MTLNFVINLVPRQQQGPVSSCVLYFQVLSVDMHLTLWS